MRVEISAEKSFHFQALDRSAPLLLPGCTWKQGRRQKPQKKYGSGMMKAFRRTPTTKHLPAWVCKSVQIGWNSDVSEQTLDNR